VARIRREWEAVLFNDNTRLKLSINIKGLVICLPVSLSVGMWMANGNPNPCTDLDKILHTHPHLSQLGFGIGLTPAPSPLSLGGLKHKKQKYTFLRCSAGCKLTWASPGTSAILLYKPPRSIWSLKKWYFSESAREFKSRNFKSLSTGEDSSGKLLHPSHALQTRRFSVGTVQIKGDVQLDSKKVSIHHMKNPHCPLSPNGGDSSVDMSPKRLALLARSQSDGKRSSTPKHPISTLSTKGLSTLSNRSLQNLSSIVKEGAHLSCRFVKSSDSNFTNPETEPLSLEIRIEISQA